MSQTLSIERGDQDAPLLDETIGANLRRMVRDHPDREAVVFCAQGVRRTLEEFWRDTSALASALINSGIQKGERVGIWSSNRYEWLVVQHATARIGVILVTINPAYLTDELGYALGKSGVKLLFHASHFKQTNLQPIVDFARPRCPQLRQCVELDTQWRAFLEAFPRIDEKALAERECGLRADDPINIQYTSGTTGFPKGATLTHRNILNNAYHCALRLGYTQVDRVCVPVPFYHCFGMVLGNLACLSSGACLVIPGEVFQPLAVSTLR